MVCGILIFLLCILYLLSKIKTDGTFTIRYKIYKEEEDKKELSDNNEDNHLIIK